MCNLCRRLSKVTQQLPVAEPRRVRRPRRAETAAAETAAAMSAMSAAVAVAVAAAAAEIAPVYPVARCDIHRRIRRQSPHRRPRAIRADAAATGTAVAATGDNTREENG